MRGALIVTIAMLCPALPAQQPVPTPPPGAAGKAPPGAAGQVPPGAATGQPLSLTLENALQRARAYSQQFLSADVAALTAREETLQARAARFPTLNAFNQYIYTQGNHTPSGIFVANDGVHVYNEQATVHAELFSLTRRAEYQRALAAEAAAQARRDIAVRGLVATVAQNYYGVAAAQRHLDNARQSLTEARQFFDITQKQERGGEVAYADVIKAQLQLQQRERDLLEAQANLDKARLALGVLLFSDIAQPYNIVDDLASEAPLPPLEQIRARALAYSPEVRAAQAGFRQAQFGVRAARGAYWPSLVLDYFYGIDANVLGITGPDGRKNLGSMAQATVNVPVWNWGITRSRVRQAELAQRQAQVELTFAQRQLQADISGFYLEAQAARAQLDSLRSSVDLAADSLRLTTLRYQGGEATALEVVDAQSTLAQSRNAYADGLARYRVALANLRNLAGSF